jgi:hypothetical protein
LEAISPHTVTAFALGRELIQAFDALGQESFAPTNPLETFVDSVFTIVEPRLTALQPLKATLHPVVATSKGTFALFLVAITPLAQPFAKPALAAFAKPRQPCLEASLALIQALFATLEPVHAPIEAVIAPPEHPFVFLIVPLAQPAGASLEALSTPPKPFRAPLEPIIAPSKTALISLGIVLVVLALTTTS